MVPCRWPEVPGTMQPSPELLRLNYDLRRSHREMTRSLGVANSAVGEGRGVTWSLPEGLDDAGLEAALFPAPPSRVPGPEAELGACRLGASAPQGPARRCWYARRFPVVDWSTGEVRDAMVLVGVHRRVELYVCARDPVVAPWRTGRCRTSGWSSPGAGCPHW